MAQAHKLDREAAAADCRFIIRSENKEEALELAENHTKEVHGRDYADEEVKAVHLQVV